MRCVASIALAAFVLAGCGSGSSPTAPPPSPNSSTGIAAAYLSGVLDTMQANSINRYRIDWASFRQTVTHPAISTALGLLDDHHSLFVRPDGSHISNPNRLPCSDPDVATPSVPPEIGYVRVGSFSGSGLTPVEFAVDVQRRIAAADKAGLSGWIVDLRGNGGGSMWPMVAGLGPILGRRDVGGVRGP
jgi:carboxyl-terminal processing protease